MRAAFSLAALFFIAGAAPGEENSGDASGDAVVLEDVVVTSKTTVYDQKMGEKLVLGSDVLDLPLIDNDVFRAVQVHPGVAGGDFNANFSVRGGETDETLILIDGVEIFKPFHLHDYGGALSALDMLAVKKVNLTLGGYQADYGDKLSGVLEADLKDPSRDFEAGIGLDLLNAHLFLSSDPAFIAVRAGYIGLLMGLMQSEEKYEPHYWDVLARFVGEAGGGRFSAGALYAGDSNRMDKPGETEDVSSLFHNGAVWARWQRNLGDIFSLDSHVFGGAYRQERTEGISDYDDRDLSYAGVGSSLAAAYSKSAFLKAGLDLKWMRGFYDYRECSAGFAADTAVQGCTFRAFLLNRWRLAPGLDASFGGRFIYLSPTSGTHFAPSAAVSYSPIEGLSFKAAWGRYLQPVDPLHLPVEAGVFEIVRPERAEHWIAGAQYTNQDLKVNLRIEAYYKEMDHLAGFVRDFGRQVQCLRVPESATAAGLELVLDKGLGDFTFHLGYAYSVAREKSGGIEYFRDSDQRHALNAGASFKPGDGWSVNVMWRGRTGSPFTRTWFDAGVLKSGPPNGGRLPPYHSLDVRVSKQFDWGSAKIQVYLQILNLYDRANVHEYTLIETSPGIYSRNAETLFPLLPTLGINIAF